MSSFPRSSSCQCHTVKRVIVLQGLISVRADIRLRFIIAEKKMCGTRGGCLSRVITSVYVLLEVLIRAVLCLQYDVRSVGNLWNCYYYFVTFRSGESGLESG